ncbi:putative T7SS-secreted protein [Nocardia sp. NPDC055321]
MGIGDWLGDKVNQIGNAVENAAETVVAKAGEAVDDYLDSSAGIARDLGLDSLGEGLDDLGDKVSSALGGQVEERELEETEDPKELIRGEPSAITEAGTGLGKLSTAADQTGAGLRSVGNIGDWVGAGADGYKVGFTPQPTKWLEAADAFTDAKTALDAWSAAVSAAQGVAADAVTQWKAAVQERRRVLTRWNSLTDEQKSSTKVVDTWSPMFQAARDTLARARTNRDTAAAQAVTAIAAAKATAPEEPPFISRMSANIEDLGDIGEYARLSFSDGLLTAASGLVQFVRQLNPNDPYNLTHPGKYQENLANLAGGLVATAADPGPAVDKMIDYAAANPFEALGAVTFEAMTAIPTGGAGLAAKPASLVSKLDNLAPSGRGAPHVPARTPEPVRAAPDNSAPRADTHPNGDGGAPHRDSPDPSAGQPRNSDAPATDAPRSDVPPQDRGAGAAPDSGRPDPNVQAAPHDQPAPVREQPNTRESADDNGGGQVDVPAEQPRASPDSPATRPEAPDDAPAPRSEAPATAPARADDPSTPGTRPDSDPPDPAPDTYTPPKEVDQTPDAPAQRPNESPVGPARADDPATPGTDPAANRPDSAPNRPDSEQVPNRPTDEAPRSPDRTDPTTNEPRTTGPAHTDPGANSPGHQANPDSARTDNPASTNPKDTEPTVRTDNPHTQSAATTPTSPVRDAPSPTTRPDPSAGPARTPDNPSGRGPAQAKPHAPKPEPATRPTPESPAGPRPHPGDNTAPRSNLDSGPDARPRPEGPDTPRRDTTPENRPSPEPEPKPDPPRGREPDPNGDRDGIPDRKDPNQREGDGPDEPKNDPNTGRDDTDSDADQPTDRTDSNEGAKEAANDPARTQTDDQVAKCNDPVDAATGEFLLPETDLTLPGVLPLVLTRRHRSNHRWGRWFGPSWSSTLDMRVVVDEDQITFIGEDGLLLAFPHAEPGIAMPPLAGGSQYTCVRTESGTYRVADPEREIVWHFTTDPAHETIGTRLGEYTISAITDRHRNRIRFHYDFDGAPTALTHTGGYHVEITTDPAIGRVTALAVVDTTQSISTVGDLDRDRATSESLTNEAPRLVVRRFGYDAGNLTAVTNGVNATTRYTYDDLARMLSWTDSRGTSMVNTYDSAGRVILQQGTDGILSSAFEYIDYPDGSGHLTRHINSQGAVTTRGFDHDLRVRDIMDPIGAHTRFDYNSERRPLRVTAPDSAITCYSYSQEGDITRVVRPDGLAADITYAWRNRPESIRYPDGSIEHREWDALGNLAAVTDSGGARTSYTYHSSGAIATVTKTNGATTHFEVDKAGLLVGVIDPLGALTTIDRDVFGRPIRISSPLGATHTQSWTPSGRPLERISPDGHTEIWSYDGEGNVLTHTNSAGGVTRFSYGSFDLLMARTDPAGATTTYSWDTERRLTGVTNPNGQTWHYCYDLAGRMISQTDYNGATTEYTHDDNGRISSVTPATGVTLYHTHDVLGRLTAIASDSGDWIRYVHDPSGRIRSVSNGGCAETSTHTLNFTYNAAGKLSSQQLDTHPPMLFERDNLARRTRRTSPTGAETRWHYDHASRPSGLTADDHDIAFTHDVAGRLIRWRLDELAIENDYTLAGRLRLQTVTGYPTRLLNLGVDSRGTSSVSPKPLRSDEYDWRPDGYITRHTTHRIGHRSLQRNYALDSVGRVAALTYDGIITENYAYDPLGNITNSMTSHQSSTETSSQDTAYALPAADESPGREYTKNLLIQDGRNRYHYDPAGRLTRKIITCASHKEHTWHYQYNSFDQLTDVWTPDNQRWHYTYDGYGRRTSKQRISTTGQILERIDYVWDGNHLIEEVADDATTRWQYLPGTFTPLTQEIDRSSTGQTFNAIVSDAVGQPSELYDPSTASSVGNRSSNLWGETDWRGAASTKLRFPGQIYDPETGLHYNLHRIYDPATGRYNTTDPLGLVAAPNPSTYPHNTTKWIDPLGLIPNGCRNGGSWDIDEEPYLYRGIPYADQGTQFQPWMRWAYDNAMQGIAEPRWGRVADANTHAGGDTDSSFTSWTTDHDGVALDVSLESSSGPGVVMRIPNADGPGYHRVPGVRYTYTEFEVTILGNVYGAEISINGGPWIRPN